MTTFVEIDYQGSLKGTDFMWGVHVKGCRAINDDLRRQFGTWRLPASTLRHLLTEHEISTSLGSTVAMRELLDLVVDGECRELGWGDDNVKVHNCVKEALRA